MSPTFSPGFCSMKSPSLILVLNEKWSLVNASHCGGRFNILPLLGFLDFSLDIEAGFSNNPFGKEFSFSARLVTVTGIFGLMGSGLAIGLWSCPVILAILWSAIKRQVTNNDWSKTMVQFTIILKVYHLLLSKITMCTRYNETLFFSLN